MSDEAFAEYVAGKTIAIIGPAPFRRGDVNLALDHDLIYRVSEAGWNDRIDIQFLSKQNLRDWTSDQRFVEGDWLCCKVPDRQQKLNTNGQVRTCRLKLTAKMNPNQVTGAIMDLEHFEPADVNVYGADLYIEGPSGLYRPGYYMERFNNFENSKHWAGIQGHRPWLQHETARAIMLRTGWFSRSTAYREALELDNAEYMARLKDNWGVKEPARPGWAA